MIELLEKLNDFRKENIDRNLIVFTSDIDWASEYAISEMLDYFGERKLPLTLFLTHESETIDVARAQETVKCGIHPNFMPDSSQGKSFEEVIDYCFKLLPDAKGFRAHRYFDVNDTIERLYAQGIRYESNICTHLDVIPPFLHRSGMIGFPIFMEDGGYLYRGGSLNYADIRNKIHKPGIKVINIHPMHFVINTPYYTYMREIKDRLPREEYKNLDEFSIKKLRCEGPGISYLIMNMIDDILESRIETVFLDDLYCDIIKR